MNDSEQTTGATDDAGDVERPAAELDRAIAESQRVEREERDADLAKQRDADERIVQALTEQ